jgi:radical SAM protein (TIGR01212 family)
MIFKYSDSNKRYYTLDYYYKKTFGSKVFKVSLNQNCTCPNIDGTKGINGCIYCKHGGASFGGDKNKDIITQFNEVKEMMLKKWPNAKYIAYFQTGTNTYCSINKLKKNCEDVLKQKDVIGINIATRCDAISTECLDYLTELDKKTFLTIELGLQTILEKTSILINRGHTLEEFEKMVKKLKERNLKVVVHIINGLPYETKEMMLETAKYLNKLNIDGIKIHMLHILKGTKLEEMYQKEKFHVLTKEEYIDIVVSQLELLKEDIVIHRITGDPDKNELIEPTWLIKKFCVLNDIDKEQKKRDSYQGKYYSS